MIAVWKCSALNKGRSGGDFTMFAQKLDTIAPTVHAHSQCSVRLKTSQLDRSSQIRERSRTSNPPTKHPTLWLDSHYYPMLHKNSQFLAISRKCSCLYTSLNMFSPRMLSWLRHPHIYLQPRLTTQCFTPRRWVTAKMAQKLLESRCQC